MNITGKWRVGRSTGRTIWFGLDVLHGMVDTPAVAQRICDAMTEIGPLRERAENAEARVAELEHALHEVEHWGTCGISEDGCAVCHALGDLGDRPYTVAMQDAGEHLTLCPVGLALYKRATDSVCPIQQAKTQEKTMSNEIPRRSRIDLFTPAEKAIFDAVAVVEAAGCDVRLTHAVNKLAEARALVADFVDGVPFGEGYPRPVAGASTLGAPSLEMLARMTPAERSAFVASAPQVYAETTGATPAGYVSPVAGGK